MGNYRPQPKPAFKNTEFIVPLGVSGSWEVELFVRFSMYRNQIRDFAIVLWAARDDDRDEVECVDCCDGQLHRHRMSRSHPGDRQRDRHLIVELNRGDEVIVDSEYERQLAWAMDNWESAIRRWERD